MLNTMKINSQALAGVPKNYKQVAVSAQPFISDGSPVSGLYVNASASGTVTVTTEWGNSVQLPVNAGAQYLVGWFTHYTSGSAEIVSVFTLET